MLPKLKLPQTRILAHINTESCLQQNTSAFKCQRVILKEDVAQRIVLFTFCLKRKKTAKKTCKYPVINGPTVQKCITFSRVYKFASCLKSDQDLEKTTKSSPHIFREIISLYVAGLNWRVSFQKWNSTPL